MPVCWCNVWCSEWFVNPRSGRLCRRTWKIVMKNGLVWLQWIVLRRSLRRCPRLRPRLLPAIHVACRHTQTLTWQPLVHCRRYLLLVCHSAHDRAAEYCDGHVCLSVCLSVHNHIFRTTRLIFTKFFVHVTSGHGLPSWTIMDWTMDCLQCFDAVG